MNLRLVRVLSTILIVLLLATILTTKTWAAVIITAVQTGGDVVFSLEGGGSLDTSGLSFLTDGSLIIGSRIIPSLYTLDFGAIGADLDLYVGLSPPGGFGSGGETLASSFTGGPFGIVGGVLVAPDGYVSGASIGAATMTFSGATFASLGITPGSYQWVLEGSGDTITLNTVIPVPPAAWLFGSALALAGFLRRRTA